jgi:hypothetical protein
MTVASLVGVATFNLLLSTIEFESTVATAFKWMTLLCAGSLVFAVQLGVQTLPTLMSGKRQIGLT